MGRRSLKGQRRRRKRAVSSREQGEVLDWSYVAPLGWIPYNVWGQAEPLTPQMVDEGFKRAINRGREYKYGHQQAQTEDTTAETGETEESNSTN